MCRQREDNFTNDFLNVWQPVMYNLTQKLTHSFTHWQMDSPPKSNQYSNNNNNSTNNNRYTKLGLTISTTTTTITTATLNLLFADLLKLFSTVNTETFLNMYNSCTILCNSIWFIYSFTYFLIFFLSYSHFYFITCLLAYPLSSSNNYNIKAGNLWSSQN